MHLDDFVDLFMKLAPSLNIIRREPAADTFGLEVGVKLVCEALVFGGVTDKARVELNSEPTSDFA
jgi:hypothetical protein